MVTPFSQVFDKIRDTYEGTGSCMFDVFVKQADGQTFWERKCWSFRVVIRHYTAYVCRYPDRAIAITHYGKLVASAYWANGDVYFQHFPNSIYFEETHKERPEPFYPMKNYPFKNHKEYVQAIKDLSKWGREISNHLKGINNG